MLFLAAPAGESSPHLFYARQAAKSVNAPSHRKAQSISGAPYHLLSECCGPQKRVKRRGSVRTLYYVIEPLDRSNRKSNNGPYY